MKTPRIKSMVLICCMFAIIILFSSSGAVGSGGPSSPEETPFKPLILSESPNKSILKLWGDPGNDTIILYDSWEILVFGSINDSCKIKINDFEAFNGSLEGNVLNLSFDASTISTASVRVDINGSVYLWKNIIINHQGIDYTGAGGGSRSNLKFTESDLNNARLKSAGGVVVATLVTIPIVWKGVRLWRNKQGVVQW